MGSLSLFIGLSLMLTAFLSFSLLGKVLFTYGLKKVLKSGNPLFSINKRIDKHASDTSTELNELKKIYQKKNDKIAYKTMAKQQALFEANTKIQIRLLAKSTKKQLKLLRKQIASKELVQYKKRIKYCVVNQDMESLLNINYLLIEKNKTPR